MKVAEKVPASQRHIKTSHLPLISSQGDLLTNKVLLHIFSVWRTNCHAMYKLHLSLADTHKHNLLAAGLEELITDVHASNQPVRNFSGKYFCVRKVLMHRGGSSYREMLSQTEVSMRRDAQMHSAVLSKSSLKREGEALSLHPLSPSGHELTPCKPLCLAWPLGTGTRMEQGSTSFMGLQGPSEGLPPGLSSLLHPHTLTLLGSPAVSTKKCPEGVIRRRPITFPKRP